MDANPEGEVAKLLREISDSNRALLAKTATIRRAVLFLAFVVGGIIVLWIASIVAVFVQSSPMKPHLYPFFDGSEPRQSQPK